ncbi:MAG: hypothetical protein KDE51_26200, partial [Anaerolineales bacterium]|nr:hypothetical protein [Anaerolineales bacterium]
MKKFRLMYLLSLLLMLALAACGGSEPAAPEAEEPAAVEEAAEPLVEENASDAAAEAQEPVATNPDR